MINSKIYTRILVVATLCVVGFMMVTKFGMVPEQQPTKIVAVKEKEDKETDTKYVPKIETLSQPPTEGIQKRFPKVLIAGFSKCGTHALRTFLTIHPKIVSQDKELNFFNKYFDKGFDWYRDQMPESTSDQITIEKTPSYVISPEGLQKMHDFDPSLKLIILVRDPVVRLQSLYARLVYQADGEFDESLEEWIKTRASMKSLLSIGNYAPHIRDVYSIFKRDQILIIDGEILTKNPYEVVKQCEEFIGIEPFFKEKHFIFDKEKGFYCVDPTIPGFGEMVDNKMITKINRDTGCFTSSKGREHPKISEELEEKLVRLYRATTEDLFHVMGKRFSWTGLEEEGDEEAEFS